MLTRLACPCCCCCCSCKIVFALIAFAAAASLNQNWPSPDTSILSAVRFMVFTGVLAFLLAIFYAIVCCVEGLKRTFSGLVEVLINGLWVIFWMAAAASFAAYQPCKYKDFDARFTRCDVFITAQAFAWLSWLLWIASLAISIIEMRRGEGFSGGEGMFGQPCGTAEAAHEQAKNSSGRVERTHAGCTHAAYQVNSTSATA